MLRQSFSNQNILDKECQDNLQSLIVYLQKVDGLTDEASLIRKNYVRTR
jgi:hypothetical protein